MADSHARLSPSNHRWVHCPGSIREEANYEQVTNDSAIDGTGSHLLLEKCLENNIEPGLFLGSLIGANHPDKPKGWTVRQDRIDRVEYCTSYIERRKKELRKQHEYCYVIVSSETKSYPGKRYGRDDWWGTVDITISVHLELTNQIVYLEVVDYKDGHTFVDVNNNPQLVAYAAGKLPPEATNTVRDVRLTVIQPKTKPPIRSQDLTYWSVMEKAAKLNEAAKLTDNPEAPLIAGKHCKWCSHEKKCSAKKNEIIEGLGAFMEPVQSNQLFESIEAMFKDVDGMTSDELGHLLDAKPALDAVFKKASQEIERRLSVGERVSGYAMLPGNSSNIWAIDEEELVKILKARRFKKEDIYPCKLISPAQALSSSFLTKEQKSKLEKEYIKNVPGKLSLKQVERKKDDILDIFDDVVIQCSTDDNEVDFF